MGAFELFALLALFIGLVALGIAMAIQLQSWRLGRASERAVRELALLAEHPETASLEVIKAQLSRISIEKCASDSAHRAQIDAVLDKLIENKPRIGRKAHGQIIFSDGEIKIRYAGVAQALGRIGDYQSVKPLIQALSEGDRWVRLDAADALSKIGAPAVEPLIKALQDEDELVRSKAAEALGRIGDPKAIPELARVAEEDEYVWVAETAQQALDRILRVQEKRSRWGTFHRINLNTATLEDLTEYLECLRISPDLAQRIINYREKYGPFARVEDIEKVPGVKGAIFRSIKDRITVES